MEQLYTIGEIAQMLGISRDTLRFYEKKGLIKATKGENGYRYYTSDNIWTLLDIIFYRKINFSLEEIDSIINHSTYQSVTDMTFRKIKEETEQLKIHRQSLIKLQLAHESYLRISENLNCFSIRPFPKNYIISSRTTDGNRSRDDWFQSISDREGCEFCYIHEEFTIEEDTVKPSNDYLMIASRAASRLGIEKTLKQNTSLQFDACVYTIIISDCRTPKSETILETVRWAKRHCFPIQGTAYSDYLLSCTQGERTVYYLELFLPLLT